MVDRRAATAAFVESTSMPHHSRSSVQVVPYVGHGRSVSPSFPSVPVLGSPGCLRAAIVLSCATLLMDVVGATDARSTALAIGALLSGNQLLVVGAIGLVARRRAACAGDPGCDLLKVEALVELLGGLVLLVLSVPIAYQAFDSLFSPGDCDTAESARILFAGLCSSAISTWLLLCTERGFALPRLKPYGEAPALAYRAATKPMRSRTGLLLAASAGHVADIQVSAALLLAVCLADLCGWTWLEGLAGLAGAFCLSFAAARVLVRSTALLIDARVQQHPY